MELASIVSHQNVEHITDEDIIVNGSIDDNCNVTLVSRLGSIVIKNKIDNNCNVNLVAAANVAIGTEGNTEQRKIDNNCTVNIDAGGTIFVGHRINNHCKVSMKAGGSIEIGDKIDDNSSLSCESHDSVSINSKIDNNTFVDIRAINNIRIGNKIDNNCNVKLDSARGSITIVDKIDDNTTVLISAAQNIDIGLNGGDNGKINNRCTVHAISGGSITVGDKLGDNCNIEFRACSGITIRGVVERGCNAYLKTRLADIRVKKIRDNNTIVRYFGGNLIEAESRHQSPDVVREDWNGAPVFCNSNEFVGEWWQDWGWKYGFVAQERFLPNNLNELVAFVTGIDSSVKTKAVGGGWSFTDAVLPFQTQSEVDDVSMEKRGAGGSQVIRRLLEGIPDSVRTFPYDHYPNNLVRAKEYSTSWNQSRLTNEVRSGFHLPANPLRRPIIDIKRLASSLNDNFNKIKSSFIEEQIEIGRHFFHVEAGIAMSELNILLDHQSPRLAIQASGGSPGATLAGTISTATHGGEFKFPLLVDRIKAIHLVGPGGVEWWIEGEESIADYDKLVATYPNIRRENFITSDWSDNEKLPNINANDMLKSVVVSMGTIGVIYSVVIEVVPAYGIQQITKRYDGWKTLLDLAGVSSEELRSNNEAANERLLNFICDGSINGTGIGLDENIYVDLAINPVDSKCWIINRRTTPELPRQGNGLNLTMDNYLKSFESNFRNFEGSIFRLLNNQSLARLMDFLNYGRSISDLPNVIGQFNRLINFVLSKPPLLANLLLIVNGQVNLNESHRSEQNRKRSVVGDILTALFDVLMGTVVVDKSDITDLSYKVGAIGWTEEGLPGKGFEIALPSNLAFTFLQTHVLDVLLESGNAPVFGYVSIRVCPKTDTLMGMQQFGEFSVMIEPVGFRTPESVGIFNGILESFFEFNRTQNAGGMLHWGLENDLLDREKLQLSAVNRPLRPGLEISKLQAFKEIKHYIQGDFPAIFDNYFVERLGLNIKLRRVTGTRKSPSGVILGLCTTTGFVSTERAIENIRNSVVKYFVQIDAERVFLIVVNREGSFYLRTNPNLTEEDNLDNLPDC